MEACYLCGLSGKHSFDCPKFSTAPAPTIPTLKDWEGNVWYIDIIKKGSIVPTWATRGWVLDNDRTVGDKESSPLELAKAWEEECRKCRRQPGWTLSSEGIIPGAVYTRTTFGDGSLDLTVFGPKDR